MTGELLADNVAWGKLDPVADWGNAGFAPAWHPLIDHMIDVAACLFELAHCRGVRRPLERAAGRRLTEVDLVRLAVFAFFHDIGKANAGFQALRWPGGARPTWWPPHAGHSAEAILAFTLSSTHEHLHVDSLLGWGDAAHDLLRASISHHGRPVHEDVLADTRIWEPVTQPDGTQCYDPQAILQEIGRAAQAMYPLAFTGGTPALPTAPAFAHLFAGLVQLADWLGSDRRFFPFSEPGEVRLATATERARAAVAALHLQAEDLRERLIDINPSFAAAFNVRAPRAIQGAASSVETGPLLILESETGSGKTEAALWRFKALFQAGLVDSLYFAVPTRVAGSQLYDRVLEFANRIWAGSAPTVVRALPGYEAADGQVPERLPHFKVLWADDPSDRDADKRWAAESPKRFLAATLAVGTIDQALLGAVPVRHAHLRHALLSRSLLVVDEVHASDAFTGTLLERLLAAHLNLGGHALLLSATLGSIARARFQRLLPGRTGAIPALSLEQACAVPYPALSDGAIVTPMVGESRQKTVHWSTSDAIDAPERIAVMALDAAKQGARVLIIRNTVPAAIATLRALEALEASSTDGTNSCLFKVAGVGTVHHSRFSRQDRPHLDAEVEKQIGKHRTHAGGIVVVGTQTLEQSLDLDADFLITDLCPMDVLLQRIGRLHRHVRPDSDRPEAYRLARAVVLTPAGGDLAPMLKGARHGLGIFRSRDGERGGIYPDLRIVEATRRLVEHQPTCVIPRDNRFLVEHATHPESLAIIESDQGSLSDAWRTLGEEIEGSVGMRRTKGYMQALPFERPFDEELSFPTNERIATRLGAEDRLVQLEPPVMGPFGQLVRQLTLRHHMVPRDVPWDATPVAHSAGQGWFEFTLGPASYRYSRIGLESIKTTGQHSTTRPSAAATGEHA
ncbi:CRISPR-associated helicase Cas3' [Caballeronia glebae]|uniref:CRISPR-associated helicase Cas3' n=1 Tax=Caballeronia glebae TaxID=1777143 RepID=UPI0038BE0B19